MLELAGLLPSGGIMKLLPLLSLKDKRLEDLTIDELGQASSAFGIDVPVTSELKTAAIALLHGKDLNTVSDLIQSPESVTQLVTFLKGGFDSLKSKAPVLEKEDDVPFIRFARRQ